MQPEFWHARWAANQIGFHEPEPHVLLRTHFDALRLSAGARIFVPLCGMTLDIDWLLSRGCRVVGVELSALAVSQLFKRLGADPKVEASGGLARHSAPGLEVFTGDIFALTSRLLGAVDAVYDRAALIALPLPLRERYAAHVQTLVGAAPQLVITLEYDQQLAEGPPFSVSAEELHNYFGSRSVQLLSRHELTNGLKGKYPATESAWWVS